MGAGDALFQHRRVPRQVDVDHGIRGLKVQAGGAGVGGEEHRAIGAFLESVHQRLPLCLRHLAVEADKACLVFFEDWLHQIKHGRPFREHDELAVFLGEEAFEKGFQLIQFCRMAGFLFIDEIRAVRGETVRAADAADPFR